MSDHSVFWVYPILTFIITMMMCGIAVLSRDKPREIPLIMGFFALGVAVCWHLWSYYNTSSLSSMFHASSEHVGYYHALWEFGTKFDLTLNFVLLGIEIIAFVASALVLVGIVNPPNGKS